MPLIHLRLGENGKMVTSMVNPQKENGTTVILTVDSQQENFIVIGKT